DGDGLSDGEGDGVGVGSSDGGGVGVGFSFASCASGAMSAARTFGAPFLIDEGAWDGDGDGAADGAGAALGEGDGLAGTQKVPSLVHQPARPLRSTPGMSSDFGGAVRAGADVPLGAALGAALGAGDGL